MTAHLALILSVDFMALESNADATLTQILHIRDISSIQILTTASGHAPVDSQDNTMVISLLNHACSSAL